MPPAVDSDPTHRTMSLSILTIDNLRCITHAELDLHPAQNLIWGENGSGKTSLLEAMYLLGRGRSFRTRNSERLVRLGERELTVVGRVGARTLGIQVARGAPTLGKVGGTYVTSLAELSQAFPVQAIDPSVHKLIEDAAQRRRRWLDWAVFHVEPGFVDIWSRYTRALRQRNAALKDHPEQAFVWDTELARLGEQLAESRRLTLERLQPYWSATTERMLGETPSLTYVRGWAKDSSLLAALTSARPGDLARGITQVGPHRDDIRVRLERAAARDVLSRGQQKLVAVSMILAQLRMLQDVLGIMPTLLLDDPSAELDETRQALLIDQVSQLNCQLVVTSLSVESSLFGRPQKVFHVEQGTVSPV